MIHLTPLLKRNNAMHYPSFVQFKVTGVDLEVFSVVKLDQCIATSTLWDKRSQSVLSASGNPHKRYVEMTT